ncbi:MAG: hypothetical protein Q7N50_04030 [Armatimonadota bacterium]|nr:hypothetical protein [Armatimonadota bacterium]
MAELTQADRARIVQALGALDDAKKALARAKVAGIETADREAEVVNLSNRLRQFQQAFWPAGKPTK